MAHRMAAEVLLKSNSLSVYVGFLYIPMTSCPFCLLIFISRKGRQLISSSSKIFYKMKFCIKLQGNYKNCRLGELSELHSSIESRYETPLFMFVTKKGSLPNLTKDIVHENFSTNAPLCVPAQQFASDVDILKAFKNGVAAFASLKNHPVGVTVQDPCIETPTGYNKKKSVSVWSNVGRSSLNVEEYQNLCQLMKPDFYEALNDADTRPDCPHKRIEKSIRNTSKFLEECFIMHTNTKMQAGFFCPLVGGHDIKEREKWSEKVSLVNFDGYSLLGIHSSGETALDVCPQKVSELSQASLAKLPLDKPKLASGAYSPLALIELIENGVDIFDSSLPFFSSEKGRALCLPSLIGQEFIVPTLPLVNIVSDLTSASEEHLLPKKRKTEEEQDLKIYPYEIDLTDKRFAGNKEPLLVSCSCYTCKTFTKGYVHHLLTVRELLAPLLLTLHNLHQWEQFFVTIRESIRCQRLSEFKIILSNFINKKANS